MLIADLHNIRYKEWQNFLLSISNDSFDVVGLLGDIYGQYLSEIRDTFIDKKIIGVLGNHDQIGKFDHYNIENIHGRIIDVNGFAVLGVEGSVKYKYNDRLPLYTQEEMIKICDNFKKADIVLTHNSPYGIHDRYNLEDNDIVHQGFIGLKNYIEKNRPKYCIHGHQHIDKATKYLDTNIVGVYGANILDVSTGKIKKFF